MFHKSAKIYFIKSIKYLLSVLSVAFLLKMIVINIVSDITWGIFVLLCVTSAIVPNVMFWILFHNSIEFKGLLIRLERLIPSKLLNIIKKNRGEAKNVD